MGATNSRIVRRSNALLDWAYGRTFRYAENMSVGSSVLAPVAAALGTATNAAVLALGSRYFDKLPRGLRRAHRAQTGYRTQRAGARQGPLPGADLHHDDERRSLPGDDGAAGRPRVQGDVGVVGGVRTCARVRPRRALRPPRRADACGLHGRRAADPAARGGRRRWRPNASAERNAWVPVSHGASVAIAIVHIQRRRWTGHGWSRRTLQRDSRQDIASKLGADEGEVNTAIQTLVPAARRRSAAERQEPDHRLQARERGEHPRRQRSARRRRQRRPGRRGRRRQGDRQDLRRQRQQPGRLGAGGRRRGQQRPAQAAAADPRADRARLHRQAADEGIGSRCPSAAGAAPAASAAASATSWAASSAVREAVEAAATTTRSAASSVACSAAARAAADSATSWAGCSAARSRPPSVPPASRRHRTGRG